MEALISAVHIAASIAVLGFLAFQTDSHPSNAALANRCLHQWVALRTERVVTTRSLAGCRSLLLARFRDALRNDRKLFRGRRLTRIVDENLLQPHSVVARLATGFRTSRHSDSSGTFLFWGDSDSCVHHSLPFLAGHQSVADVATSCEKGHEQQPTTAESATCLQHRLLLWRSARHIRWRRRRFGPHR